MVFNSTVAILFNFRGIGKNGRIIPISDKSRLNSNWIDGFFTLQITYERNRLFWGASSLRRRIRVGSTQQEFNVNRILRGR